MTATSRLCAGGGGGGIMGPSFCPLRVPQNQTFQLLLPCPQREGGREGRERSEIRSTDAEQQARVRTRGTRRFLSSMRGMRSRRHAAKRRSHLTRTFPCILAVSIRLFSFIVPPSVLPIRHRALQTGGVLDRCCPLCRPATSQPASPPGSESARKWVGLQPGVDY